MLDARAAFDELERVFLEGDAKSAGAVLSRILGEATQSVVERDATYAEAVRRCASDHPGLGARYALCAGALVENGADPLELANAVRTPLARALSRAAPFLRRAWELPEARDDDGERDDGDGDEAGDAMWIGSRAVEGRAFAQLAEADPEGVIAFESLDVWYRPVVAAWTRCTDVLRDAQRDQALVTLVDDAGRALPWVFVLLRTALNARFVVMLPESRSAFVVRVDGVTDVGQLSVLLSRTLAAHLAPIGVSKPAGDDVVDVMNGKGPQESKASWSCEFHLYPWQALDASTSLPKDGQFMWSAPGGTGSHSLPPDFIPSDIVAVDGMRPILLVGPKAEGGMRFTRVIGAVRSFDKLAAHVELVETADFDAWLKRIA